MAVDSRDKRFSMILLGLPGRILPNPDGTLDEDGDRLHLLPLYRGISVSGVPVAGSKDSLFRMRRRLYG